MATLYPTARAHQGASDIDMDDFEVDIGLSGTPMMQDNLEVEDLDDMTYNEVDFDDAHAFDSILPGSPHSVAMDNQDVMTSVPDEDLLDYSETIQQGQDPSLSHTENLPDVHATTTESWNAPAHAVPAVHTESLLPSATSPKSLDNTIAPHTNQAGPPRASSEATKERQEEVLELDNFAEADANTHQSELHAEALETTDQTAEEARTLKASQSGETVANSTEILVSEVSARATSPVPAAHESNEQNAVSANAQSPKTGFTELNPDYYQLEADRQPQTHTESSESLHVSLHPVLVEWHAGEIDWLFRPSADNARQGFYLEDASLASQSYSTLFQELRLAIGDDISADEEIEIEIPVFDVSIREDSCDDHSTFADLINIYLQLQGIDGQEAPEPLQIKLHRRTRFSARLAQLQEAIVNNKGLSELDFLNVASSSSSEFDDQESQMNQAQDHSESFDDSQHVENEEQFAHSTADYEGFADDGAETQVHAQETIADVTETAVDDKIPAQDTDVAAKVDDDLIDYDDELITTEAPYANAIKEEVPGLPQSFPAHTRKGTSPVADEATAQDEATLVEPVAEDFATHDEYAGDVGAEAPGGKQEEWMNTGEDGNTFADGDLNNSLEQPFAEHEANAFDPSASFDDAFADAEESYDEGATASFEDHATAQPEPIPARHEVDETEAPAELPEFDEDDLIDYDDEDTAPATHDTGSSTPTIQGDSAIPTAHADANDSIATSPSSKRPRDESPEEEPSSASGLKRQKSDLHQDT